MSNNLTYKEAFLIGNFLTILLGLFAIVGAVLAVVILYFTADVNPGSPMAQFIEWVNAL
jgi:hypothetical protein